MEESRNVDEELKSVERQRFDDAIGDESDPIMLVLRGHLFSESLLERIIRLSLPRGDKIVESASFSYAQKLLFTEALDTIPDSVCSSLRGLNKLRNQCAHELGRTITDADVVKIGSPLGKEFTVMHRQSKYDPVTTLRGVIHYVTGFMTGACNMLEMAKLNESKVARLRTKEESVPALLQGGTSMGNASK